MGYRPKQLPRVLNEDEQEKVLDTFNTRYWTPERNRAMTLVMLDAGLRVSECVSLKMDHVDLARRKLTVRSGKGEKDRVVPIAPRLYRALSEWMDRREEDLDGETDLVFPTRSGNRVHPNHVRKFVKRAAERAELPEWDRVSPHTLRHTACTDLYKHSKDLAAVAEFAGHASTQTAEIYVTLANGHVEEAMDGFREDPDAEDGEDPDAAWNDLDEDEKKALLSLAEKMRDGS